MNRRTPVAAAALLLAFALTGCAAFRKDAPPADRISAAEESFTTIIETLNTLRALGYINDADQIQVNRIEHAISAAFDSAKTDLAAGRPLDTTAFLRGVRASMNELTIYEKAAEDARRRSPPVGGGAADPQPAPGRDRSAGAWRRHDRRAA